MSSCTNIECPVPVRWDDHLGDGLWVHSSTGERACPNDGATPPLSQRRQRPAERFWRCTQCRTWVPVAEDGHGRLSASCIGPALRVHPEVTWVQPFLQQADPPPAEPEVRLSPDGRLVAIRTGEKKWAQWRVSDGTRRTDARVADWRVLPLERTDPAPASEPDQTPLEYGIEYHYSPGRWHVLPNTTFTDPVAAAKAVGQRNKARGAEDYRPVRRRAAGPWEPMLLALLAG